MSERVVTPEDCKRRELALWWRRAYMWMLAHWARWVSSDVSAAAKGTTAVATLALLSFSVVYPTYQEGYPSLLMATLPLSLLRWLPFWERSFASVSALVPYTNSLPALCVFLRRSKLPRHWIRFSVCTMRRRQHLSAKTAATHLPSLSIYNGVLFG